MFRRRRIQVSGTYVISQQSEGKKLRSREACKLAGLAAFELSGFQVFRLPSLIAFKPLAMSYQL